MHVADEDGEGDVNGIVVVVGGVVVVVVVAVRRNAVINTLVCISDICALRFPANNQKNAHLPSI